jgi:diguanylate cyclase (GGDEF)-like protein
MEKPKILIIDDDPNIRKTLSDILKIKGYESFTAENGANGLDLLKRFSANLVIIDLGLPDISGLEVLNRVKTSCPFTETIILTGNASLDSAIEATNKGAFSYLLKPYDIDQLMLHIKHGLEKQQAQEIIARRTVELEKTNAELKSLYEVSRAINQTIDMDELFSKILRTITKLEILRIEHRCAVFLLEEDRMRLISHIGLSEADVEPCRSLRPGECLCGLAAATGEIIISKDARGDSRRTIFHPDMLPHGHIVVPLKTVNKVVGVLCLCTKANTETDENVLNLLLSIGNQIGVAVENIKLYEETKSFSLHDSLTGLANRRFLVIQLEKSFELAKRYKGELSAIMLDIDHFKGYNDKYGHIEGDNLLIKLANILSKSVRDADYVFRYGGEEFFILLPGIDIKMAYMAAERLRTAIEKETGTTISLGVSSVNEYTQKKEGLVADSDNALYLAKRHGRNRVEVSAG